MVDAACVAATRVASPLLPIVFDRAALFNNSKAACVFQCDKNSSTHVAPLRNQLGAALRDVGLHPKGVFTPHMTMLYDDPHRSFESSIEPLAWTATRFVLILRHVAARYRRWFVAA
jgi:2'-5' RNA ligase